MACTVDHSGQLPRPRIEALDDSQRDFWRHKCAGCAYEMGRADATKAEASLRERVRELKAEVDRLTEEIRSRAGSSPR
jgi:hypothetical protein